MFLKLKKTGQVRVAPAHRVSRNNFMIVGQREVQLIKVDKLKFAVVIGLAILDHSSETVIFGPPVHPFIPNFLGFE